MAAKFNPLNKSLKLIFHERRPLDFVHRQKNNMDKKCTNLYANTCMCILQLQSHLDKKFYFPKFHWGWTFWPVSLDNQTKQISKFLLMYINFTTFWRNQKQFSNEKDLLTILRQMCDAETRFKRYIREFFHRL